MACTPSFYCNVLCTGTCKVASPVSIDAPSLIGSHHVWLACPPHKVWGLIPLFRELSSFRLLHRCGLPPCLLAHRLQSRSLHASTALPSPHPMLLASHNCTPSFSMEPSQGRWHPPSTQLLLNQCPHPRPPPHPNPAPGEIHLHHHHHPNASPLHQSLRLHRTRRRLPFLLHGRKGLLHHHPFNNPMLQSLLEREQQRRRVQMQVLQRAYPHRNQRLVLIAQ